MEMGYILMDKSFIDLLEKELPSGTRTAKAYNANKKITDEDLVELSKIGNQDLDYETSCNIMRRLIKKIKGNNISQTIPLLYRQAIFFIAYKKYDKDKKEVVQAQLLRDLGLAHNSFTKWKLMPIKVYEEGNDKGEDIGLNRDGKKNKILCFMFGEITSNIHYKRSVDVFGGLGIITAYKPIRRKTKVYINDFDKSIANLLGAIKYKPEELERLCREKLKEIQLKIDKDIFEKGKETYAKKIVRQNNHKERALKSIEDIRNKKELKEKDLKEISKKLDYIKKKIENINKLKESADREELEYILGLHKKFDKEVKKYRKSKTREEDRGFVVCEEKVNIKMALSSYFLYSFTYKNNTSITGVKSENLASFENKLDKIKKYSNRFRKVEIRCCDFKAILEDEELNREDTLAYVDPPYYRTKQYAHEFTDKQHRKLHDTLKKFKGKWVLSCRWKATNNSSDGRGKDEEEKIESFLEYFEMYADIAKYVVSTNHDEKYEIMITNFDFDKPDISAFKFHRRNHDTLEEIKQFEDSEYDDCFVKETYEEFLDGVREEDKNIKAQDRLKKLNSKLLKYERKHRE